MNIPAELYELRVLDSGYYHYRISSERWAQWPRGRDCTSIDCFGWDADETARLANQARARAIEVLRELDADGVGVK